MASLKASLPTELETTRMFLEFWNGSEEQYAAMRGAFDDGNALEPEENTPPMTNARVTDLLASIAFEGTKVCPGKTADTCLVGIPRLKSTGERIGCIIICQEPHYKDVPTAGWLIQASFWGQGLAPEAAKELLRFATEDLGIKGIVATPKASNLRSHRCAEKAGMVRAREFTNSEGMKRVMFHLPGMEVTGEQMATIIGNN